MPEFGCTSESSRNWYLSEIMPTANVARPQRALYSFGLRVEFGPSYLARVNPLPTPDRRVVSSRCATVDEDVQLRT